MSHIIYRSENIETDLDYHSFAICQHCASFHRCLLLRGNSGWWDSGESLGLTTLLKCWIEAEPRFGLNRDK
jgi:hypothetical protein